MATWIRHTHPDGFRTGTWAEILGVRMVSSIELPARPCFEVEFNDGVRDYWAVYDESERYEFTASAWGVST